MVLRLNKNQEDEFMAFPSPSHTLPEQLHSLKGRGSSTIIVYNSQSRLF